MEYPSYNRSLERALKILKAFGPDKPNLSLGQLSEAVALPKPTVFRLCSTLVEHGFLKHDQDLKNYSLGLKLFELGSIVFSSFSLRKIASRHLVNLQSSVSKTVFLAILESDELLYIDKKDDLSNPIRFASEIGKRRPPYYGMLGQVLLSFLPEDEANRLLKKYPPKSSTKKSVIRMQEFKKLLLKIREQGFVIEQEGTLDGITGIAAPIRDFTGSVVAALGVAFITSSEDEEALRKIVRKVLETGETISLELGYSNKL